jgi:hypothetical protein
MKTRGLLLSVFFVVLITGLLISGCGKDKNSFTASTPGGKVTVNADKSGQGTVQIETKDGKVVVTGQQGGTVTEEQLGVPVYPGATVKGSSKMEGPATGNKGGTLEMYTLMTPDSLEKVTAFYKTNLKNVKNSLVQGSGDQGMAMFSIGDDGAISVNIVSDKNKETVIQVAKKTK